MEVLFRCIGTILPNSVNQMPRNEKLCSLFLKEYDLCNFSSLYLSDVSFSEGIDIREVNSVCLGVCVNHIIA